MKIELIYDATCPNVEAARVVLKRALDELQIHYEWKEWNRAEGSSPEFIRKFGSPTILVNGKDVAGVDPQPEMDCCRLYEDSEGKLKKVPPVENVINAICKEIASE